MPPPRRKYARRALDLSPEEYHLGRGAAAALLGLASWASGYLEAAARTFADGMASLQKAGDISDVISGTHVLADIRIAQGRLHAAESTYQQSLQLASEQGEPMPPATADLYTWLSELHRAFKADFEALQRQRRALEHRPSAVAAPNMDRAAQKLRNLPALWAHPGVTPEQRRDLARNVFEEVRLREGKLVGVKPKPQYTPRFAYSLWSQQRVAGGKRSA